MNHNYSKCGIAAILRLIISQTVWEIWNKRVSFVECSMILCGFWEAGEANKSTHSGLSPRRLSEFKTASCFGIKNLIIFRYEHDSEEENRILNFPRLINREFSVHAIKMHLNFGAEGMLVGGESVIAATFHILWKGPVEERHGNFCVSSPK